MDQILSWIYRLSQGAFTIAGITLTAMMLLTVSDVILRTFGRPLVGAFELVAFFGAVAIGFSIPLTSWVKGHIYVDFLISKLSPSGRKGFQVATRSATMVLFIIIGWNLFKMGLDLQRSGEVSPTLQLPFFPIVYGIGMSCLLESAVLFADMVKIFQEKYE